MCKHGLELLEMTAVGLPRLQISDYVCTLMKEGGKTAQFMQAIRSNLNYLYSVMAIIYICKVYSRKHYSGIEKSATVPILLEYLAKC